MRLQLENNIFIAQIDTLGAELCSLLRKDSGEEFVWQGDERYWAGHAPTLFPITGKLKDLRFEYNEKNYELPPHGFAKEREFFVQSHTKTCVELVLEADRETLRQYPFLFRFTCVFTLTAAGLAITRRVENTGKEKMYFSVGEHLGLSLAPWGGSLENYALVFPAAQTAWNWQLNKGLLDKKTPYLDNTDTLPLSKALFQTYGCLVLQGLSAPWVALRPVGNDRGIRVSIGGFAAMVVWSPDNDGQFVCVEPWQGLPSEANGGYDLTQRPCILHLSSGERYEYTVTVEPE